MYQPIGNKVLLYKVKWAITLCLHVKRKRDQYSGNDWYLGAVTDENARTLEVKLTS